MDTVTEPRLLDELKSAIDRDQAAGEIITAQRHDEYIRSFRERSSGSVSSPRMRRLRSKTG